MSTDMDNRILYGLTAECDTGFSTFIAMIRSSLLACYISYLCWLYYNAKTIL